MSVPSVVQTDSDSFCVGNDDESSISPSESASLDVTSDSAKVPPPNLRSTREWYVSQSNSKQVLFAMAVGLVEVNFKEEPVASSRGKKDFVPTSYRHHKCQNCNQGAKIMLLKFNIINRL